MTSQRPSILAEAILTDVVRYYTPVEEAFFNNRDKIYDDLFLEARCRLAHHSDRFLHYKVDRGLWEAIRNCEGIAESPKPKGRVVVFLEEYYGTETDVVAEPVHRYGFGNEKVDKLIHIPHAAITNMELLHHSTKGGLPFYELANRAVLKYMETNYPSFIAEYKVSDDPDVQI